MREPSASARRRTLLEALAVAASFLVAAPSATATIVLAMELPALTAQAERIVVADVLSVRAAWNADRTRITTTVELGVIEAWKGDAAAGRRIAVVQPGGAADDIETIVHGMPRWTAGERAVVFLRGAAAASHVVGMAQGKRALSFDAARGEFVALPADRSTAVVARGAGRYAPAPPEASVPLTNLRAAVKALLRP